MEFFHKATNFPFMGTRKIWYGLSVFLVVGCFVSFFTKGLNLAIDFTGGVSVEVTYPDAVDVDAVRKSLEAAGFHEPSVQTVGSAREIAIRLAPQKEAGDVIRARIDAALRAVDPG